MILRVMPRTTIVYALTVIILVGLAIPSGAYKAGEYQVKAAFMFRFLFFAEWPDDAFSDSPGTITIAILGDDPFEGAFDSVRGKAVNERILVVKHYDTYALSDQIFNCQILFLCSSLSRKMMKEVIESLGGRPVMTVSDVKNFTSLGGMVNFRVTKNKVTFDINNISARSAGIHFRAKLLRLATRVIEDKGDD